MNLEQLEKEVQTKLNLFLKLLPCDERVFYRHKAKPFRVIDTPEGREQMTRDNVFVYRSEQMFSQPPFSGLRETAQFLTNQTAEVLKDVFYEYLKVNDIWYGLDIRDKLNSEVLCAFSKTTSPDNNPFVFAYTLHISKKTGEQE